MKNKEKYIFQLIGIFGYVRIKDVSKFRNRMLSWYCYTVLSSISCCNPESFEKLKRKRRSNERFVACLALRSEVMSKMGAIPIPLGWNRPFYRHLLTRGLYFEYDANERHLNVSWLIPIVCVGVRNRPPARSIIRNRSITREASRKYIRSQKLLSAI